jgi:hypothetical protein
VRGPWPGAVGAAAQPSPGVPHPPTRLGGRNSGTTYRNFVSGFATTAHDAVTIQSVSGNVVTAQVTAEQTDGTVKTYQGTYTVNGGVITQFNVQQTS